MKIVTRYIAFDGREFPNEADCKKHEAEHSHLILVGLSAEELVDVLSVDWKDPADKRRPLADALEQIGVHLSRLRVAAGDKKRERKPKGFEPETVAEPPGEEPRDLVAEANAEMTARMKARAPAGEFAD